MASRTTNYRDWLNDKLSEPGRAANYLNAASRESHSMFLKALRKVAAVNPLSMTQIAESCDISRESLYRMLSETGNPTSDNERAILAALGLTLKVVPIEQNIIDDRPPSGDDIATRSARKDLNATHGGSIRGNALAQGFCSMVGLKKGPSKSDRSISGNLSMMSSSAQSALSQAGASR